MLQNPKDDAIGSEVLIIRDMCASKVSEIICAIDSKVIVIRKYLLDCPQNFRGIGESMKPLTPSSRDWKSFARLIAKL